MWDVCGDLAAKGRIGAWARRLEWSVDASADTKGQDRGNKEGLWAHASAGRTCAICTMHHRERPAAASFA